MKTLTPFVSAHTHGQRGHEDGAGPSNALPSEELTCQAGGDAIIGVYDGHGEHGHHVSRCACRYA